MRWKQNFRDRPLGAGLKPPQYCCGKEPWWEATEEKAFVRMSGVPQEGERKRTIDEVSRSGYPSSKPGVLNSPGTSPAAVLKSGWAATGIKMARACGRLIVETLEPVVPMLREKSKWRTHEDLSTEAEHRGGVTRSSAEVPVMGEEQRGRIAYALTLCQREIGGTHG